MLFFNISEPPSQHQVQSRPLPQLPGRPPLNKPNTHTKVLPPAPKPGPKPATPAKPGFSPRDRHAQRDDMKKVTPAGLDTVALRGIKLKTVGAVENKNEDNQKDHNDNTEKKKGINTIRNMFDNQPIKQRPPLERPPQKHRGSVDSGRSGTSESESEGSGSGVFQGQGSGSGVFQGQGSGSGVFQGAKKTVPALPPQGRRPSQGNHGNTFLLYTREYAFYFFMQHGSLYKKANIKCPVSCFGFKYCVVLCVATQEVKCNEAPTRGA